MLMFTLALNPLFMLLLPMILGVFLCKRLGVRGSLFGVGALTFVGSQVVHIPLNAVVGHWFSVGVIPMPPEVLRDPLLALGLGLSAGVCEEVARYLALRFWVKDVRDWSRGMVFGVGHGGIESIIVGLLAGVSVLNVFVLQGADVDSLLEKGVPPEQAEAIVAQLTEVWEQSWWFPLLGVFERSYAIVVHIAATLLVMMSVVRRSWVWLAAAVALHTALNATVVYAAHILKLEAVWVQLIGCSFGLGCLFVIVKLYNASEKRADNRYEPIVPIQPQRVHVQDTLGEE